jgi:hypothetical protein
MVTVKHVLPLGEREKETKYYPLGEREVQTKPCIAVGDRDPPETQRPLGPVHTGNET